MPASTEVPFVDALKTMWGYGSFRQLSLGAATQAFVGYGSIAWMPSFLIRTYDMSSGQVGTALGLIIGIGGGLGTFLGGMISDRLAVRNTKWYMWLPAGAFLLTVPFGAAVFIVNIIGLVFGPTVVGLLSHLFHSGLQMSESESLRWSLFACNLVYLISAANYYLASKTLKEDLANTAATDKE